KGPGAHEYFWIADRTLGYRNRANGSFENALAGSTVTTGPHGERKGVRWTDDAARPIVLFVGDSTTFCAEVDDDDTASSEVAKRLPPDLDVAVVNAGVRGYSTVQSSRIADEWLARSPVRLVVYTFCDNDYYENVSPVTNVRARAPAARIVDGRFEYVELPGEGAWGEPLLVPSPESSWTNAYRAVESRSALLCALGDLQRGKHEARVGVPADDGSSGVALIPLRETVSWARSHGADAVLERVLADMGAACRARGARLLVTRYVTSRDGTCPGCPEEGSSAPREALALACQKNAISRVDLDAAFTRPTEAYLARLANGAIDPHANALGTRTYAEALAPRVIEMLRERR
ncbi:SGNH/GDSL hydrolase family protein, partial [bacterium]|nr:SGNH/GDSL hydrolase family protein [bacterium]